MRIATFSLSPVLLIKETTPMHDIKPSTSRRVLSTVLSLVIVLAPVTATAQEVEQNEAQPPADAIEMARTAIAQERGAAETTSTSDVTLVDIPERLQRTFELLRTPGYHPELLELLGVESVSKSGLPTAPPAALKTWHWIWIGVAIGVAAFGIWASQCLSEGC